MKTSPKVSFILMASVLLSSCSTTDQSYEVQSSRIASGEQYQLVESDEPDAELEQKSSQSAGNLQRLPSLLGRSNAAATQQTNALQFSASDSLSLAAENMPAREFIHTVFGELLGVSYVVAEGIPAIEETVTLNLKDKISSRELFLLASKILDGKNIAVSKNENVFFVHPKDGAGKGDVSIGVGRSKSSVPQSAGSILQMVPLRYGMNVSLERTLIELTSLAVTPDFQKNVLFLKGERTEVFRALDLIDLMDVPASRGKFVSILRLTYISPEMFINRAQDLLLAEGIGSDNGKATQNNLVLVPLEQIGAVALFGSDEFYVERAGFWASQLDKPSEGSEKRYYIFHPRYARAADLGQSIAGLLGQSSGGLLGNSSRDTASALGSNANNQQSSSETTDVSSVKTGTGRKAGAISVQTEELTMTVDDRSNTIIFYTTGIKYQTLLPMIKRLDVMPKQILLEATIAEVTLTDNLDMGVEFAFKNGNLSYGTTGLAGSSTAGGFSLSFIDGADKVITRLKQSNTVVNVLSSPSLVVRDGVNASINVGNDLPTVGSTTTNVGTDTTSTSVNYRKTGVDLSVTPTINAQGMVILQIEQNISNTVEASTVADSPAFFERSIKTEVLAQSGQTIMLGGLMSEDVTNTNTKVPLLGDLPLIGFLFRGKSDEKKKTELIILITPKVIDQPEQWQGIKQKLDSGLQHIKLQD